MNLLQKKCNKCGLYFSENEFRLKKNSKGNYYKVSICIYCERKQKNKAEKIRYHNLSKSKKKEHSLRSKKYSKTEKYRKWHKEWQKNKENKDINFKLKRRFSALLRYKLKKDCSTFDLLDYSLSDLKKHLESKFEFWMNWNNWGVYDSNIWDDNNSSTWTWQIDHIIPISNFTYLSYKDEEFKKCWALNNLRPLSSKQNIFKGNKDEY